MTLIDTARAMDGTAVSKFFGRWRRARHIAVTLIDLIGEAMVASSSQAASGRLRPPPSTKDFAETKSATQSGFERNVLDSDLCFAIARRR